MWGKIILYLVWLTSQKKLYILYFSCQLDGSHQLFTIKFRWFMWYLLEPQNQHHELWSMKHEPNRTENLIDSQLERESFPEEFHPNNMEFVYDTRPCYRLGWAAGRPLSKAPFGYGGPKIPSLLSTEIAPCPLGGRPFSCFVEWPPIWGWTCLGVEKAVAGRRGAFLLLLAIMVIISMYMIFFFQFICDNFMNSMSQSNIW